MDDNKYNNFIEKLNKEVEKLSRFSPGSSSEGTEKSGSSGLISKDTDVEKLSENDLALNHALLHMFYSNKSGRNLTPKTIEQLHRKISKRIKGHTDFDTLDKRGKNGLY